MKLTAPELKRKIKLLPFFKILNREIEWKNDDKMSAIHKLSKSHTCNVLFLFLRNVDSTIKAMISSKASYQSFLGVIFVGETLYLRVQITFLMQTGA